MKFNAFSKKKIGNDIVYLVSPIKVDNTRG